MALVLVIDDDASVRRMIRRVLESADHRVSEAADGREGTKTFGACRPDIVITDIVMPEKEGIETIMDIRRMDADVPIIAVSGGGADIGLRYLDLAGRLGASAILPKPFRAAELKEAVAKALNERKVLG